MIGSDVRLTRDPADRRTRRHRYSGLFASAVACVLVLGIVLIPNALLAHGAVISRGDCMAKHVSAHHAACRSADTNASNLTPPLPPSLPPATTPTPVPTPVYLLAVSHTPGSDTIVDQRTSAQATTSLYEFGTTNALGLNPPPGFLYLWVFVSESAAASGNYFSAAGDFQIQNTLGSTFAPSGNFGPVEAPNTPLIPTALGSGSAGGNTNTGWIQFTVPAALDSYTLSWNEDGAIPFTGFALIAVFPNGPPGTLIPFPQRNSHRPALLEDGAPRLHHAVDQSVRQSETVGPSSVAVSRRTM